MKQHIISGLVATAMLVPTVDAASIGRSGGFSRPSVSRSVSAPKPSIPTQSAVPARSGGIGGTTGSLGVRKTEPTQQAAANLAERRGANTVTSPTAAPAYRAPTAPTTPSYNAPVTSQVTNGSTFMSSLGGSFVGSALGNMLFGNHNSGGGTTVINNTTGAGSAAAAPTTTSGAAAVDSNGFAPMPASGAQQSYGIWGFIKDVVLFALLVGVLVAIAYAFYKGYKMIMNFIRKERGKLPELPFNPTARFWEIQNAFSTADKGMLNILLGPDLIYEITRDLEPSVVALYDVSHQVVLSNASEISVHYTFTENAQEINQVWHYERHNGGWVLNGIENI